jgi:hypothetical protein
MENRVSGVGKDYNELSSGLLISDFLRVFEEPGSGKKMHVYSAHDYTTGILLGALLSDEMRGVDYAGSFVFELIQFENDHFVRVF